MASLIEQQMFEREIEKTEKMLSNGFTIEEETDWILRSSEEIYDMFKYRIQTHPDHKKLDKHGTFKIPENTTSALVTGSYSR